MSPSILKQRQGFTLIEIIIYLALFGIFMSGAVAMSYNMFESFSRSRTKMLLQEEGNFLTAKIGWALSSIQDVNAPITTPGSILSVNKVDVSIGAVTIDIAGNDMRLARGSNAAQIINSVYVKVNSLVFTHGTNPESVSASFTLSAVTDNGVLLSQNFAMAKYMRQ